MKNPGTPAVNKEIPLGEVALGALPAERCCIRQHMDLRKV